jgi:hypothetical protein
MSEAATPASPAGHEKKWQEIQKKTFTGWVNYHLGKKRLSATDIEKDFSDGVLLVALLEQISQTSFGKIKQRTDPKVPLTSRPHCLDNLSRCVKLSMTSASR